MPGSTAEHVRTSVSVASPIRAELHETVADSIDVPASSALQDGSGPNNEVGEQGCKDVVLAAPPLRHTWNVGRGERVHEGAKALSQNGGGGTNNEFYALHHMFLSSRAGWPCPCTNFSRCDRK